jgi:hypothetical protein
MSTIKNISGDYTISTYGASGIPGTGTVTVNGNLVVTGNSSSIQSTNTSIKDNIITLNRGETGAGVTLSYAGVEIDRGLSANVSVRWNEPYAKWQLTTNGSTFANIATSTGSGNAITAVVDDPAPVLGGNLNITGHTIYNTTSNVAMYSNTVAGGGSGIFVDANGSNQQELVTKSKALAFSIIFG